MKVWTVCRGDYEQRYTVAAFSTRELAEKWVADDAAYREDKSIEIEELELDVTWLDHMRESRKGYEARYGFSPDSHWPAEVPSLLPDEQRVRSEELPSVVPTDIS